MGYFFSGFCVYKIPAVEPCVGKHNGSQTCLVRTFGSAGTNLGRDSCGGVQALNLVGYFFSGFCVYKMLMASVNIIFNRVAQVSAFISTLRVKV